MAKTETERQWGVDYPDAPAPDPYENEGRARQVARTFADKGAVVVSRTVTRKYGPWERAY